MKQIDSVSIRVIDLINVPFRSNCNLIFNAPYLLKNSLIFLKLYESNDVTILIFFLSEM